MSTATATMTPDADGLLIDSLLRRQREPTAVERFARHHDGDHGAASAPAMERYYRDLLPLSAPGPGQQYAFEVDLDACSGCKACVAACHSLNGLDEDETWRDVGVLVGGTTALPILQHVTAACHHCADPACMNGCPVLAYEKDPVTGIVRHLDDQCIGCQYCILKCPYDAPKYSRKRGIVRKCDMCSDRLATGEAPACVQACPNGAIRITLTDRPEVSSQTAAAPFLPAAPDPDYTRPTTVYKTRRALPPDLLSADHYRLAPQHAHWPLVFMLVLTQLSVGAFAVGQALTLFVPDETVAALRPLHAAAALAVGMIALGASVLHLGRPLYAFRAVIGLRTSWLSREILAFGLFAGLAWAYAVGCWLGSPVGISADVFDALGVAVAVVGLGGVFCSVMIYHDTRRPFWRGSYTAGNFLLTTLLLGTTTLLVSALCTAAVSPSLELTDLLRGWGRAACLAVVALSGTKLLLGILPLRHLRDAGHTPMKRTARLLCGPLLRPMIARNVLTCVGGILLPLLAAAGAARGYAAAPDVAVLVAAALLMTLAGEFTARYLFFAAVVAPKMPGGLGS